MSFPGQFRLPIPGAAGGPPYRTVHGAGLQAQQQRLQVNLAAAAMLAANPLAGAGLLQNAARAGLPQPMSAAALQQQQQRMQLAAGLNIPGSVLPVVRMAAGVPNLMPFMQPQMLVRPNIPFRFPVATLPHGRQVESGPRLVTNPRRQLSLSTSAPNIQQQGQFIRAPLADQQLRMIGSNSQATAISSQTIGSSVRSHSAAQQFVPVPRSGVSQPTFPCNAPIALGAHAVPPTNRQMSRQGPGQAAASSPQSSLAPSPVAPVHQTAAIPLGGPTVPPPSLQMMGIATRPGLVGPAVLTSSHTTGPPKARPLSTPAGPPAIIQTIVAAGSQQVSLSHVSRAQVQPQSTSPQVLHALGMSVLQSTTSHVQPRFFAAPLKPPAQNVRMMRPDGRSPILSQHVTGIPLRSPSISAQGLHKLGSPVIRARPVIRQQWPTRVHRIIPGSKAPASSPHVTGPPLISQSISPQSARVLGQPFIRASMPQHRPGVFVNLSQPPPHVLGQPVIQAPTEPPPNIYMPGPATIEEISPPLPSSDSQETEPKRSRNEPSPKKACLLGPAVWPRAMNKIKTHSILDQAVRPAVSSPEVNDDFQQAAPQSTHTQADNYTMQTQTNVAMDQIQQLSQPSTLLFHKTVTETTSSVCLVKPSGMSVRMSQDSHSQHSWQSPVSNSISNREKHGHYNTISSSITDSRKSASSNTRSSSPRRQSSGGRSDTSPQDRFTGSKQSSAKRDRDLSPRQASSRESGCTSASGDEESSRIKPRDVESDRPGTSCPYSSRNRDSDQSSNSGSGYSRLDHSRDRSCDTYRSASVTRKSPTRKRRRSYSKERASDHDRSRDRRSPSTSSTRRSPAWKRRRSYSRERNPDHPAKRQCKDVHPSSSSKTDQMPSSSSKADQTPSSSSKTDQTTGGRETSVEQLPDEDTSHPDPRVEPPREPDLPPPWIRCSPADLYFKADKQTGNMCSTKRMQDLESRFESVLCERAQRHRDEQPPFTLPSRQEVWKNHCHHHSTADHPSCSAEIVESIKKLCCEHREAGECDSSSSSSSSSSDSSSSDDEDNEEGNTKVTRMMAEFERKRLHPYRLHDELWYNEPGELNDSPVCRCSIKSRRTGIRHNIYPGEKDIPHCLPPSNNKDRLFHYRISMSPVTNFLTKNPTLIEYDNHEYIFEGFSLFTHYKIENVPQCTVIRFNIEYTIHFFEEPMPENFSVHSLDLFARFLFTEILELIDLNLKGANCANGCERFHIMPRFARTIPDNGKEILSMNEVLSYLLNSSKPLLNPEQLATSLHSPEHEWQDLITEIRGMIVTAPGRKPCSIRVDQLDRQHVTPESYTVPLIIHFGIRPAQLSYVGDPLYQRAWRHYVKFKRLLYSKPKISYSYKMKLMEMEEYLQEFKQKSSMKREVTIEVSCDGFLRTGIKSDICQHALLLPVLLAHMRFHRCLGVLEDILRYSFADRSLLQLSLTHDSHRVTFGTNSDHARNSLSNCGIRQLEYGDKKIHSTHTRKRGINILIQIMARMGCQSETHSKIPHNERLEFLGDSVIEFLSSVHLYFMFPWLDEGGLTTYRAAIVQNQHLAIIAKKLHLEDFMLYAHGPDLCHESDLKHAMANCFEALMGALYLDGGIELADSIFARCLFGDSDEHYNVWMELPEHPLQEDEPDGDRHWIQTSPALQKLLLFEEKTGIEFDHIRLLARAFTLRNVGMSNLSFGHNQRMEFLGDTVLQLIASEYLYKHFPGHHEGHLSLLRSSLVNSRTQSIVCDDLGMCDFVIYGEGRGCQLVMKTKERADLLEAFLGALFVDKGLGHCLVFCEVCFFPRLKEFILNQDWNDPKSLLQQCCLTLRQLDGSEPDIPVYKVLESTGPTNTRKYTVAVYFRGERLATGTGSSIQEAEMKSALNAMTRRSGDLFPIFKHQKRFLGNLDDEMEKEKAPMMGRKKHHFTSKYQQRQPRLTHVRQHQQQPRQRQRARQQQNPRQSRQGQSPHQTRQGQSPRQSRQGQSPRQTSQGQSPRQSRQGQGSSQTKQQHSPHLVRKQQSPTQPRTQQRANQTKQQQSPRQNRQQQSPRQNRQQQSPSQISQQQNLR